MIKFTALNENYPNDEDIAAESNEPTKEDEEKNLLDCYSSALELIVQNKKQEAVTVFNDILKSDSFKDCIGRKPDKSIASIDLLKYSCLTNIARIQNDLSQYEDAISNYCKASYLDNTDVMLWYKIGSLAMKVFNIELACYAFNQGLKINPKNWLCLDAIITVYYVIPDYLTCTLYIFNALQLDPSYSKGIVLQQQILKEVPTYKTLFDSLNKNEFKLDPNVLDLESSKILLEEIKIIKEKWLNLNSTKVKYPKDTTELKVSLEKYSLSELGDQLIKLYNHIIDYNFNIGNNIYLSIKNESTEDISASESSEHCIANACEETKYTSCDEIDANFDKKEILQNGEISDEILKASNENEFNLNSENDIIQSEQQNDEKVSCKSSSSNQDTCSSKITETEISELLDSKIPEDNELFLEKESIRKAKKRRRDSLTILTKWAWSNDNKRSSRVRVTSQKECQEDDILLEQTLKKIFPATLLSSGEKVIKNYNKSKIEESSIYENNFFDESCINSDADSSNVLNSDLDGYFGTKGEVNDVQSYMNDCSGKTNIIVSIYKFCKILHSKWNFKWPKGLSEVYIKLYLIIREQLSHGWMSEDSEYFLLKKDCEMILLFCEIFVDKLFSYEVNIIKTQEESEKPNTNVMFEDLGDLLMYSSINDLSSELYIRLLWVKANAFYYFSESNTSIQTFKLLLDYIENSKNVDSEFIIKLSNCQYNSIINIKTIKDTINFILRTKQMNQIEMLRNKENYEDLSLALKETFYFENFPKYSFCKTRINIERVDHLRLLLESLWKLKNYEECFSWAEICFDESWQNFTNASIESEYYKRWENSVKFTLDKLFLCIEEAGLFVLKYLSQYKLSRLVKNITHLISHYLDILENKIVNHINILQPWLLLHYILQYEEDKQEIKSNKMKKNSIRALTTEKNDECVPPSIMILIKAHEFLGRHGLCCDNECQLLKFIMKLIIPKLKTPLLSKIKNLLKNPLEQVFYCLYGHPVKFSNGKSKPKNLKDHVKNFRNITWDDAQLLFDYYQPESLPSFEAKRIGSISLDTVTLFKKIIELIPAEYNPKQIVNEMNLYLTGASNEIPKIQISSHLDIYYIYYLMADYYFKNGSTESWARAVKYYTLDLCLHNLELNSWAGLAMSTSTMLETWLNNFEPDVHEDDYLSKARVSQRSYQRATELDPLNLTIWTEYGNFVYTVHSYCSRQLKQESDLNMKRFEILESCKEEMLNIAKNCFTSAVKICKAYPDAIEPQDERWLYHYMLGKIAEKKNEDPPIILQHYVDAGEFLHSNKAEYPKKINQKNPQNLSVEALEIFYRIHASILKYLERLDGKSIKKSLGATLLSHLQKSGEGPFKIYERKSKKTKEKEILLELYNRNDSDNFKNSDNKQRKVGSLTNSELQFLNDVAQVTNDLLTEVCKNVQTYQSEHNSNFKSNQDSTKNEKPLLSDGCQLLSKSLSSMKQINIADSSNSSSSSMETSSSEDSSESNDSNASDSNIEDDEPFLSTEEINNLFKLCVSGLEQCVLRFSHHYKAIYRLVHYFLNTKIKENVDNCKKLLLETYACKHHLNISFEGLFSEKRNTNFFNGIWRIPNHEIDRPGSFAFHMSRCIVILMQVLKESNYSYMLADLCMQLYKIPEADKKYIRDIEREQLSNQAMALCIQSFRNRLIDLSSEKSEIIKQSYYIRITTELHQTYQLIKPVQKYQSSLSKIQVLMEDTYKVYYNKAVVEGNILSIIKDQYRQVMGLNKSSSTTTTTTTHTSINETKYNSVSSNHSNDSKNKKLQLNKNYQESFSTCINSSNQFKKDLPQQHTNKYSLPSEYSKLIHQNLFGTESSSSFGISVAGNGTNAIANNPMLDPNILSMFNTQLIDSTINYLTRIEAYKESLNQFHRNLPLLSGFNARLPNVNQLQSDINHISMPNVNYRKSVITSASGDLRSAYGSSRSNAVNPLLNSNKASDISITPVSFQSHPIPLHNNKRDNNIVNTQNAIKKAKLASTSSSVLNTSHSQLSQSIVNTKLKSNNTTKIDANQPYVNRNFESKYSEFLAQSTLKKETTKNVMIRDSNLKVTNHNFSSSNRDQHFNMKPQHSISNHTIKNQVTKQNFTGPLRKFDDVSVTMLPSRNPTVENYYKHSSTTKSNNDKNISKESRKHFPEIPALKNHPVSSESDKKKLKTDNVEVITLDD